MEQKEEARQQKEFKEMKLLLERMSEVTSKIALTHQVSVQ